MPACASPSSAPGPSVARSSPRCCDRSDDLRPADGAALELVAVAVRDPGRAIAAGVPADLLSDAPAHLVADERIDVIVELMGGDEPAHTLIAAALSMGKSVVTANKHVIAHHGPELEAIARRTGATLRFEAAVGGGIPDPGAARRATSPANRIERVRGIVNGTTNFILSAMTDETAPLDYDAALAEAQRLGYAEADPSGDVEGHDAANKLVILARLAFDRWLDPAAIATRPDGVDGPAGPGITTVSLADQADARRGGPDHPAARDRVASTTTGRSRRRSCRPRSGSIRRSGGRPACATGSRSTRRRSAGSASTVRARAVPRPRRRSSATSSRSPARRARRGARAARRPDLRAARSPGPSGEVLETASGIRYPIDD